MALLTRERLASILGGFPQVGVAVVGDYFLDRYLVIDPRLEERSLETGLPARQVVTRRSFPGHAGTVVNNLHALGVSQIYACGVIGDDGEGFELRRGLESRGSDTRFLIASDALMTGTFVKSMALLPDGGERELDRLDIRNRDLLPALLEDRVIGAVAELTDPTHPKVDAVIVADQVEERNAGVISDRVRQAICSLAESRPALIWYVDSRSRIGEYRHLLAKPNERECARAVGEPNLPVEECGRILAARSGRTVFLTRGDRGMLVISATGTVEHVPALAAAGPVDPTGAGDSATAGIVPALALGASPVEAGAVGALVAGLTVRQLGTTGTASPEHVRAALDEW